MFSTKDGEKMRDKKDKRLEIEAATFRRLKAHLAKSTQVQNMAVLPIVQLQHSILHVLQSVWEKVTSYGLVQIHL